MNEKALSRAFSFLILLGLGALFYVLMALSPYETQDPEKTIPANIVLFHLANLVFLASLFSFLLFKMRMRFDKETDRKEIHMGVSLRQGVLLAVMVIVIMVLQSFGVLTWWDGLLAVGAILMVELYFLSR